MIRRGVVLFGTVMSGLGVSGVASGDSRGEVFPVLPLEGEITVDGDLADWRGVGPGRVLELSDSDWKPDEESPSGESDKETERSVRIWAGHRDGRFHLAAQWADETRNAIYKPWKFNRERYVRSSTIDDMFVARWQVGESSFPACMLSNAIYRTDVWRWSAGRSNLARMADDMTHHFSSRPFDQPAREYAGNRGLVYFLNVSDAGFPGWQSVPQPKAGGGDVVPSVAREGAPSGSRADVEAVGVWKDGVWSLEMSRKLVTGDPEDVAFAPGGESVGQFAVFYAGYRLRKFITRPVVLRFMTGG